VFKNVKITLAMCIAFFWLCCFYDKPEEAYSCGNNIYDYKTEFCHKNMVYAKCKRREYNPRTQKCYKDTILTKCGNDYYNQITEFCYDEKVYAKCERQRYNPEIQKCDKDIVLTKCRDNYYDEETEFCYDNAVYKKCNGATYDLTKQKCAKNDSLLNICRGIPYEPYLQYCVNGNIAKKKIFKDSRDGRKYKTVVIGDQTWMAENLNYSGDNNNIGKCNTKFNYTDYTPIKLCDKYGRLYNWKTAMTVCPDGWHLPDLIEWQKLSDWADDETGKKLKSTSGWSCIGRDTHLALLSSKSEWRDLALTTYYTGSCVRPGDGSDEFGFSALPGGAISYKGSPDYAERHGFWWSSTNKDSTANFLTLVHFERPLFAREANKLHLLSVRCVKD